MDNSYFIYSTPDQKVQIERFHICTWEFRSNSALVEFGLEIKAVSLDSKEFLDLTLFIPWVTAECKVCDFYQKLRETTNSRFIFNDSITNTISLDGGHNSTGVIHQFSNRNTLCILPIVFIGENQDHKVKFRIDLSHYNQHQQVVGKDKANIYIRFSVKPCSPAISTRKNGISKSTILYDIKLNERRNIPEPYLNDISHQNFCEIEHCFCFNIVPNSYDLVFFDSSSMRNVRTLEFESFDRYLRDSRVKRDELIVIFHKKKQGSPFSFFSIFSKERIGAGQFALAVLVNFISGVFLFLPSFRKSFQTELELSQVWNELPLEIYIATVVAFLTSIYFVWPQLINISSRLVAFLLAWVNKKRTP